MLSAEQIANERTRRGYPAAAAGTIDRVRRGVYPREEATARAIKLLMLGSHARRFGSIDA